MAANQTTTIHGVIPTRISIDKTKSNIKKIYGLGFPIGKNKTRGGFFRRVSNLEAVRGAVKQLLSTQKGERLMLPNYGVNLRQYLFSPLDEALFNSIKEDILFSINRYIKGVRVSALRVAPLGPLGPSGGNSLKISLLLELIEEDLAEIDVEVIIK